MFAQRARHRLCDWVLLEPDDDIELTFELNSSSPPSLGVRANRVQCSRAVCSLRVWSLTSQVALCTCKNTVCSFLQHACANCANCTQPTICRLSQPHPGWLCAPFNTLCAASCNNCNILKYNLCKLCAATYLQVKWQPGRPKNGSGQPKDALFMQSKAMISPLYCIRNCNPQKNVIQYSQT